MFRKALALITVAAATGLLAVLGLASVAAQTGPNATRSFDFTTVAPGGTVTVTIDASDYVLPPGDLVAGGVRETLPAGFTYVSSSLEAGRVSVVGQEVRFVLRGETSFRYSVTASSEPGSHTFNGKLIDSGRNSHDVGGASTVTIEAASTPSPTPTPTPTPTATPTSPAQPPTSTAVATRSLNPASVAAGGTVTVRIDASGYGDFGAVTEMLPTGFAYVSSSLPASQGERERARCQVHPPGGRSIVHIHGHRVQNGGSAHVLRHPAGLRPEGSPGGRRFEDHGNGPARGQRDEVLLLCAGGPGRSPHRENHGRRLGGVRSCHGDAARGVHLHVQQPSGCPGQRKRPDGQVHAAHGHDRELVHVQGHGVQHCRFAHVLRHAAEREQGRSPDRRRLQRPGPAPAASKRDAVVLSVVGASGRRPARDGARRQLRGIRGDNRDTARGVRLRVNNP